MTLDSQQATVLAIDALEKMVEALRGDGPTPAIELMDAQPVRYATRLIVHAPDQDGMRPRSSVWVFVSDDEADEEHVMLDSRVMQLVRN